MTRPFLSLLYPYEAAAEFHSVRANLPRID